MTTAPAWTGSLEVRCEDPEAARRLYRVLLPESAREVPRAVARLRPPEGPTLRLDLDARDTGALRAAVQTFLGWVRLAEEASRASHRAGAGRSAYHGRPE